MCLTLKFIMFVGYMRNDFFSYLFFFYKSVVFCRMLGKLQNSRWQNKLIDFQNTRRRKERSGRDVAHKHTEEVSS